MTRSQLGTIYAVALLAMPVNVQATDCNDAVDQSTMNQCAEQNFKAADARLNSTYRALTQQLDTDSLERLKQAQRAWISFRDALCAFKSEPLRDGSIYPMVLSSCLEKTTDAQTSILKKHLSCAEGDVLCVRQ